VLILVRRPYDIGDKVAINKVELETNLSGSNEWFVEKFDLLTTTVRSCASSQEVATIANGDLARAHITNRRRSECANIIKINLKFRVDVPIHMVKVFRAAVENFIRDRNREWIGISSFRTTRIESTLGYIEYALVLKARESWQQVRIVIIYRREQIIMCLFLKRGIHPLFLQTHSVLESGAAVNSFCLELQRQLDMGYAAPYGAPPPPVGFNHANESLEKNAQPDTTIEKNRERTASKKIISDDDPLSTDSISSIDDGIMSITGLFETKKRK
jgi:hypothetical protein